jgi:hypothetical protein
VREPEGGFCKKHRILYQSFGTMKHILLTITLVLFGIVFGESQISESKPYQLKQAKKISDQTVELLQSKRWYVQQQALQQSHEYSEIDNPYGSEILSFSESGSIKQGSQIIGYWHISDKRLIRLLPSQGETMLKYFENFRGYFSVEELEGGTLVLHRPLDHEGKTYLKYTLMEAEEVTRFVPKSKQKTSSGKIAISLESPREDIEYALKTEYFMRGKRLPADLPQKSKEELFELYQALFR